MPKGSKNKKSNPQPKCARRFENVKRKRFLMPKGSKEKKRGRKSNPQPKCARGFEKTFRKFEPSAENAHNLEP